MNLYLITPLWKSDLIFKKENERKVTKINHFNLEVANIHFSHHNELKKQSTKLTDWVYFHQMPKISQNLRTVSCSCPKTKVKFKIPWKLKKILFLRNLKEFSFYQAKWLWNSININMNVASLLKKTKLQYRQKNLKNKCVINKSRKKNRSKNNVTLFLLNKTL